MRDDPPHTGSPSRKVTLSEIIETLDALAVHYQAIADSFRNNGNLAARRAEVLSSAANLVRAVLQNYDRIESLLSPRRPPAWGSWRRS